MLSAIAHCRVWEEKAIYLIKISLYIYKLSVNDSKILNKNIYNRQGKICEILKSNQTVGLSGETEGHT